MAILPILCYPDPRLLQVAKPVQAVDARIKALVADMRRILLKRLCTPMYYPAVPTPQGLTQ